VDIFGCHHDLFFGAPSQGTVVFRAALSPLVTDERMQRAGVKGVISHRQLRPLDVRSAEFIAPVVDASDLDSAAGLHLRRPLGCRRQSAHQEALIVRNESC